MEAREELRRSRVCGRVGDYDLFLWGELPAVPAPSSESGSEKEEATWAQHRKREGPCKSPRLNKGRAKEKGTATSCSFDAGQGDEG